MKKSKRYILFVNQREEEVGIIRFQEISDSEVMNIDVWYKSIDEDHINNDQTIADISYLISQKFPDIIQEPCGINYVIHKSKSLSPCIIQR